LANTQAICTSFKVDLMLGKMALGTTVIRAGTTKDTIKAALYLASATVNASTTAYSSTGEVTGTNYTAGGVTVTNADYYGGYVHVDHAHQRWHDRPSETCLSSPLPETYMWSR
jgi:hypothetical protein